MADRETSGPRPRVVVLSPDTAIVGGDCPDARALGGAGVDLVRVSSAYEAVAEILCEPAAALVIDLRLLGARGLGALAIARQRGVEILATGMVPNGLTVEDLSGVRLVARRDLPAALRRLGEARPAAAEAPAASTVEPPAGRYVPEAASDTTDRPGATRPRPGAADRTAAGSVLTPEELAALLEGEP